MLPFSCWKAHRELAREAVRKSLVWLKNGKDQKKPLLPLDKNIKQILFTGTHADNLGYQCGGGTITWEGTTGKITEVVAVGEGSYVNPGMMILSLKSLSMELNW